MRATAQRDGRVPTLFLRRAGALFLALAGRACVAPSEREGPPVTGELARVLEASNRLEQEVMQRFVVPGTALAIVKDSRLVVARGYGDANREAGTPVGPGTGFNLASIPEPITALTLLQLADEGRLQLEDRAMDLLPGTTRRPAIRITAARIREIIVRQLLNHSSGVPRMAERSGCAGGPGLGKTVPVIACVLGKRRLDAPGTRAVYSNGGPAVLGEIARELAHVQSQPAAARTVTLDPMGIPGVRPEANEPQYPAPRPSATTCTRASVSWAADRPCARWRTAGWLPCST